MKSGKYHEMGVHLAYDVAITDSPLFVESSLYDPNKSG